MELKSVSQQDMRDLNMFQSYLYGIEIHQTGEYHHQAPGRFQSYLYGIEIKQNKG